ncbi:uncharacterized protein LOC126827092 [Patella vulgata]|uniref:uncharacterized protein LOC126827092 n=1 Tax=Patella vulgata TaxID=6465 RepID=UPI00218014F1|nr:uncharacterized protein LOC126827092 [Patella vulgata]
MEIHLASFVIFICIIGCYGEYCTVSVPGYPGHHTYQIRCSSTCCGQGYDTRCCVSGDMIVGIFFACVAFVTIICTLLYCCIKHKINRSSRLNSGSELSFLGAHDRFYHRNPAQPIKPPPYKQHDPPPSYTEIPEASIIRRPSQSRWTPLPPATPHRPRAPTPNSAPRYIQVSSPPPSYFQQESIPEQPTQTDNHQHAVPTNNSLAVPIGLVSFNRTHLPPPGSTPRYIEVSSPPPPYDAPQHITELPPEPDLFNESLPVDDIENQQGSPHVPPETTIHPETRDPRAIARLFQVNMPSAGNSTHVNSEQANEQRNIDIFTVESVRNLSAPRISPEAGPSRRQSVPVQPKSLNIHNQTARKKKGPLNRSKSVPHHSNSNVPHRNGK